jgi:putative phosphoribosyl transferase
MTFIPYESRYQAGKILAKFVIERQSLPYERERNGSDILALAIPNGGIPVAEGFCNVLSIKYDIMIVRKLKIPYNPEAGFGSITPDGSVFFNQDLLSRLNLSEKDIDDAIRQTKKEITERMKLYHKDSYPPEFFLNMIKDKTIFFIDDGLASGFTMLAAVSMVTKYQPLKMYIAIPTAPYHTVQILNGKVDTTFCPDIRKGQFFAVANAYKNWYDVPETEAIHILQKSNFYVGTKIQD